MTYPIGFNNLNPICCAASISGTAITLVPIQPQVGPGQANALNWGGPGIAQQNPFGSQGQVSIGTVANLVGNQFYFNAKVFSFIPNVAGSGSMTIAVSIPNPPGAAVSQPKLPCYKSNGTVAAAGGTDTVANQGNIAIYSPLLQSGAGGFFLLTDTTSPVGFNNLPIIPCFNSVSSNAYTIVPCVQQQDSVINLAGFERLYSFNPISNSSGTVTIAVQTNVSTLGVAQNSSFFSLFLQDGTTAVTNQLVAGTPVVIWFRPDLNAFILLPNLHTNTT